MPCHQLLTKNDRYPALRAANWTASILKSFSWNLKRCKPEMGEVIVMGCKLVLSVNVYKQILSQKMAVQCCNPEKGGRELGLLFSSSFLFLSWHVSPDFKLYSHECWYSYSKSFLFSSQKVCSSLTCICSKEKGTEAKKLSSWLQTSHYTLTFLLKHSFRSHQIESVSRADLAAYA